MMAAISPDDVRLIAFYLPQFHPIAENDLWWGRGFTEWTNVTRARPVFEGHYQPHLPSELGFYDLRVPEVREEQAQLAGEHGIHGFCYYYYWFGGKRLLERPFEEVLATGKPDFPFCICWANETWTRRWDGAEQEVLMPQVHSDELDARFIHGLIPAFRDPRYIRVQGRPLLVIYRATQLSDAARTIAIWAQECRAAGLPPPFVLAALTFDVGDPGPLGCDGALEFPPHQVRARLVTDELSLLDKQYAGYVFDYAAAARWYLDRPEPEYPLFRTVMTGWDNTPRRPQHSNVFLGSSPVRYEEWLAGAIRLARQRYPPGGRLVFINAWNEWAEGAHLEPDQRFGRAYLEATREALTNAFAADPRPYGLASPTAAALKGETAALQRIDELFTQEELEIRCHMTLPAERRAEALRDELETIHRAKAIAIRTLDEECQRALEDEKNRVGLTRAPDIGPVALALADRLSRGLDRLPAIKAVLRGTFRKLLGPSPPRA
jgi:lipopolysaccharide biosynthesis protein